MKKKRKKRHLLRKVTASLLTVILCMIIGTGAYFGVKG